MTVEPDSTDVRKYPRIGVEYPFSYHPVSSRGEKLNFARTKTLGIGGLMFELDQPLKTGTFYDLNLTLGEKGLAIRGKIAYSKRVEPELYQIGIEFLDISEKDREMLLEIFLHDKYNFDPD